MASCSPVLAPLGTAARPRTPLERMTSASTVGFPRLSRISRAWTWVMVIMELFWRSDDGVVSGGDRVLGGAHTVEPLEAIGHAIPDLLHQGSAIARLEAGGGNGFQKR